MTRNFEQKKIDIIGRFGLFLITGRFETVKKQKNDCLMAFTFQNPFKVAVVTSV